MRGNNDVNSPSNGEQFEVLLDGQPVCLPSDRHSLAAIRSYLDMVALRRQRVLCSLVVDGEPAGPGERWDPVRTFARVEGETVDLEQMPLQLLQTALQQTREAREQVHSAVVLVLINEGCVAREFWWNLAAELKKPLLTLSLVPENFPGPSDGYLPLLQLRKWQLEQLGNLLNEVDESCWSQEPERLSNALENRVLPWLNNLQDLLALWQETILAGSRIPTRA